MAAALLFTPTAEAQAPINPSPLADVRPTRQTISSLASPWALAPPEPAPPNPQTELDTIHTAQSALEASCAAQGGTIDGVTCDPPPPPPVTNSPESPQTQAVTEVGHVGTGEPQGTLIGQLGWSTPGGNCVDEPGVNNPGWGNPIDWPITSTSPWIGASALFYFNHVAVVVGIWSNGDIEVGQENSPGAPHTYSPSQIRGYR